MNDKTAIKKRTVSELLGELDKLGVNAESYLVEDEGMTEIFSEIEARWVKEEFHTIRNGVLFRTYSFESKHKGPVIRALSDAFMDEDWHVTGEDGPTDRFVCIRRDEEQWDMAEFEDVKEGDVFLVFGSDGELVNDQVQVAKADAYLNNDGIWTVYAEKESA